MAIGRIQFRGISRTPSDRMTKDGGCAESLNLVLDDSESVPASRPEDITAACGLPEDISGWEVVYIHKTQSYTNYIILRERSLGVWEKERVPTYPEMGGDVVYVEMWKFSSFVSLQENEILNDIESIGNTLIVSTDRRMYYVLWKDDSYKFLGNQIPSPPIKFTTSATRYIEGESQVNVYVDKDTMFIKNSQYQMSGSSSPVAGTFFRSDEDFQSASSGKQALALSIKYYISRMIEARQAYKRPWAPFFIRYAVRLYDGSHTRLSPPILIGAGGRCSWNLMTEYNPGINTSSYIIVWNAPGIVRVSLPEYDYEPWSDLIQGIDIYASEPLRMPYVITEGDIEAYTEVKGLINKRESGRGLIYHDIELDTDEYSDEAIKEGLLGLSLFYKIASYEADANTKQKSIEDLIKKGDTIGCSSEDNEENHIEYPLLETLVAQDVLEDEYMSDHQVIGDRLHTYNNRLIMIGLHTVLSRGYPYLNSAVYFNPSYGEVPFCYRMRYYIKASKRESKTEGSAIQLGGGELNSVDAHYYDDSEYLLPEISIARDEGGTPYVVFEEPFGWISYPDPRCTRVDIECYACELDGTTVIGRTLVGRKSIKMEEHPALNVSFAFLGMDQSLSMILDGTGSNLSEESESRTINETNKVNQSEIDNPFVFPAGNRFSFSGTVYGIATTTKALSTGQFGQFPLYVFTSDGIWALETAADGTFSSVRPLSREVCSYPETITPIDQAIVFVTAKGVMLLQGSDITELSPDMNGRHYSMEHEAEKMLSGTPWERFSRILSDDTPFMEFISKSRIAYDYTGQRLIFFSQEDTDYQYVYMIRTGTWHKQSAIVSGAVPVLKRVLNSYPDCYISAATADGQAMLLNLSTNLDVRSSDRMQGVLISRPFDLDNPDMMKVVNRLRIRGNFSQGAVKYIILGSQDGISFRVLKTLRGGSYKLFRIIVLTDMYTDERISWVDIDFDTRFTNRLR